MLIARILALAAVYAASGRLGQLLAIPPGNVTAVWPPSGIALAAILLWGWRVWPGIWLGAFVGNTWAFFDRSSLSSVLVSLAVGASIGVGATLQAFASAWLLKSAGASSNPFLRTQETVRFILLSGVVGCLVSATVGLTSISLGGFLPWGAYRTTWLTWWLGDLAGVLVITPFFITWTRSWSVRINRWRVLEAGALIVSLLLVTAAVFEIFPLRIAIPLASLEFPFIIWSALRFGPRGASSIVLLISGLALWGTLLGTGPYARYGLYPSLLLLQTYILTLSTAGLILAASISERKRLELELRSVIGTRDEFLSIASHELKTPVTSLQLQLELQVRLLREQPASSPEKIRSGAERALASSQQLARLIDELLDLTLIRAGKLKLEKHETDLNAVVMVTVSRMSEAAAKAGSQVIVIAKGDGIIGIWDPVRIEQVISNLLSNAIKYGRGKSITITTGIDREAGFARLRIRDEGLGIPRQVQGKIFERFERVAPGRKITGLGLGLYIVRQIVDAHGGTIRVESEQGKGSLFTCDLPLGR